MRIAVISLGCAKNLVDTEYLLGLLEASHQTIVKDPQTCDALIINTCGFIESAKAEAIETIFSMVAYKNQQVKKIIVMGCLSQRYQKELTEQIPEVDRFIAIDEYANLGKILSEVLGVPIFNTYGKTPRLLSDKPWMAYLKIADGCDNRCSYCAIPLIRGSLRSIKEDNILAEAKNLVDKGVKEINLVAQDSSRYGYDFDQQLHLSSLLKKLDALEGIRWIRILYLYPDEIPDDLIETIQKSRHILPYFDIPVQHGSNAMLKAMHRRGSRALILERVKKIRESFPLAAIRTTLIIGFCNESEEDHALNISLIREAKFDHLGAFMYSREEGTPSYAWEDNVPMEMKENRLKEIMQTQAEISKASLRQWIGKTTEVLIESFDPLTQQYLGRNAFFAPDGVDGCVRVRLKTGHHPGEFVKVKIAKTSTHDLIGEECYEN